MNRRPKIGSGEISYSLRRHYVDEFHFKHVSKLEARSLVLDLGGNRIGKRGLFDIESFELDVVYANLSVAKRPHVKAMAEHVPFKEATFDVVVCSELLEHVLDPIQVLVEIFRVLRKDGLVLICVPFMTRIHGDPTDFGRYTDYYWSQILGGVGFKNVIIESQGGFWSVLAEMIRCFVYAKTASWDSRMAFWLGVLERIVYECKHKALELDISNMQGQISQPTGFTTGFGIIGVKP